MKNGILNFKTTVIVKRRTAVYETIYLRAISSWDGLYKGSSNMRMNIITVKMLLTKSSHSSCHYFRTSFPITSLVKKPFHFAYYLADHKFGEGLARQFSLRCSQVVTVKEWLALQSLEDVAGPDSPPGSLTCLIGDTVR